jgi:putative protein kinase ArgK-like GTPase of G3E family
VFAVHKADREGADRVANELRQALHGAAFEPQVLLSQDKDEASLKALLAGLHDFLSKHGDKVKARREQARKDTLAELVEARAIEQARQWAAAQASAGNNPYEGFLKFEKSGADFSK